MLSLFKNPSHGLVIWGFKTTLFFEIQSGDAKQKNTRISRVFVGMAGFEPATSRPPDEHSNRAEPHPESGLQTYKN